MARGRWCGWSGAARRSGSTGSPPARRRGEAAMRPTSLRPAPRGQEPVRPAPPREPPWPWLGLWAVVAVVVGALVRVLGPAVLDPDEYAAALYFDDLVHGRRLQEFLLSAPKPLLTLVHGLAWTVTHDWRAGTALTVAAFALAVAALARAAWRLAGAPAALAVAISLVGSGALVLQVARGNSVVWAAAGWAVALDALARPRRRWGVAAAALLLAGLARAETWLLLPPAALLGLLAWRRGQRRALLLLVPLAAPLLWLGRRRAWTWLAGLGLITLGTLTLFGLEAWRGTYVSFRYYDPADAGVRVLGALGAAWLATAALARLRRREPGRPARPFRDGAAAAGAAAVVMAAACWPLAPVGGGVGPTLDQAARSSRNTASAIRALRPVARSPSAVLVVSGPQRYRVVLELGLPLQRVRDLYLAALDQPLERALAGASAVYHDRGGDQPAARFAPLEVTSLARLGALEVEPLLADPGRGLYVLRIGPARGDLAPSPSD